MSHPKITIVGAGNVGATCALWAAAPSTRSTIHGRRGASPPAGCPSHANSRKLRRLGLEPAHAQGNRDTHRQAPQVSRVRHAPAAVHLDPRAQELKQ